MVDGFLVSKKKETYFIMKFLIYAAGKNRRFNNTLNGKPKGLKSVGDKMLIEYGLSWMVNYNPTEIIIVVGYKKELFKAILGESYKGVPIKYIYNKKKDITKLQNKRRHWKDFPKFEKAIQATLNVESSKKLMEQTRTINAADSKQINQARNTASNTVVKYRNETYTPSATYSKFKDIVPSKIEGIVDSLSNADAFFKGNNKWMLYQAIQQIGGVDSDWASFNELEAKGMRSTKIWDQNEDVTAAEIYKKAIALRKQHSSSPTYLTDAGKEYTMPLVPVPSDKITADKQDITSRKILESLEKKVTNKNTNVYGQNVFGNLS